MSDLTAPGYVPTLEEIRAAADANLLKGFYAVLKQRASALQRQKDGIVDAGTFDSITSSLGQITETMEIARVRYDAMVPPSRMQCPACHYSWNSSGIET